MQTETTPIKANGNGAAHAQPPKTPYEPRGMTRKLIAALAANAAERGPKEEEWIANAPLAEMVPNCDPSSIGPCLRAPLDRGLVEKDLRQGLTYWRIAPGAALPDGIDTEHSDPRDHPLQRWVQAGEKRTPARWALWSDGSLTVNRGRDSMSLDPDEVDGLLDYLKRRRD